jgi:hypothetical protein
VKAVAGSIYIPYMSAFKVWHKVNSISIVDLQITKAWSHYYCTIHKFELKHATTIPRISF